MERLKKLKLAKEYRNIQPIAAINWLLFIVFAIKLAKRQQIFESLYCLQSRWRKANQAIKVLNDLNV